MSAVREVLISVASFMNLSSSRVAFDNSICSSLLPTLTFLKEFLKILKNSFWPFRILLLVSVSTSQ